MISWWLVLSLGANIAQITTGAVAATIGGRYLMRARERRRTLETYLRDNAGAHSVLHLVAFTAMTEEQVFEAVHASRRIRPSIPAGKQGQAPELHFRYSRERKSK